MAIELRRRGDVRIIAFHGRITLDGGAGSLKTHFIGALEDGERRFVFNLAGAPYIDSATIGEVIACLKRAHQQAGEIKFVVPSSSSVRDTLRLTLLDRIMEIHEEEDAAIMAFEP